MALGLTLSLSLVLLGVMLGSTLNKQDSTATVAEVVETRPLTTATTFPTTTVVRTTTVTPTTTAAPTTTLVPTTTSAPPDPSLASSQQQAVRKAEEYLDLMAFSHEGLISQLEYEGFSAEDAAVAADYLSTDWDAQAARQAEAYIDLRAFSCDGLVDQLEYEGFTTRQAMYGSARAGVCFGLAPGASDAIINSHIDVSRSFSLLTLPLDVITSMQKASAAINELSPEDHDGRATAISTTICDGFLPDPDSRWGPTIEEFIEAYEDREAHYRERHSNYETLIPGGPTELRSILESC